MLDPTLRFTRQDYERLPEGFPVELLDGQLLKEPARAPWHQRIVLRIVHRLRAHAGEGRVLVAPVDVHIDEFNVLQPDVLVLPEGVAPGPQDDEVELPIVVVEVLSPSTAERDSGRKRGIYLQAGVREVWLVDPVWRTVEVCRARGSVVSRDDEEARSRALFGFSLRPETLFRA